MLSSVTSSMKQVANSFRLKVPDPYFAKEGKYFSGESMHSLHREESLYPSVMVKRGILIFTWRNSFVYLSIIYL